LAATGPRKICIEIDESSCSTNPTPPALAFDVMASIGAPMAAAIATEWNRFGAMA